MTLLEARLRLYSLTHRSFEKVAYKKKSSLNLISGGSFYEKLANSQKNYDLPHSLCLHNPPMQV